MWRSDGRTLGCDPGWRGSIPRVTPNLGRLAESGLMQRS